MPYTKSRSENLTYTSRPPFSAAFAIFSATFSGPTPGGRHPRCSSLVRRELSRKAVWVVPGYTLVTVMLSFVSTRSESDRAFSANLLAQ